MEPGWTAAAVMLATVLCAGFFVLRHDARRRQIDRHLTATALASPGQRPDEDLPRALRLEPASGGRLGSLLRRLFNYDPDAPGTWSAGRVAILAAAAAAVAFAVARIALPVWLAPISAVFAGIATARGLFRWRRDRYADRLLRQLPDTIELVVSAVRAGLPAAEAFRAVAREMPDPTGEQFTRVLDELALGRAPQEAILNLYHRTRVSEYAMFAVTLAVQNRAGGRLAETLQNLGDTVRERVALAARAKALSGEAKLSAQVLASLPFVAGAMMLWENPKAMDPLFDDPRGRVLFAFGLISLLLGIYVMRRMIKRGTTV